MLSVTIKFIVLSVIMLNDIMLSVIMLSGIMLSVIGTVLFTFSLFKNWIDAADMFQFFCKSQMNLVTNGAKLEFVCGLQGLKIQDTKNNDSQDNI